MGTTNTHPDVILIHKPMRRITLPPILLAALLGWLATLPLGQHPLTGAAYEDTQLQTITLTNLDLTESAEARATGIYESPILDAPFPFNALVPAWTADPTLRFEIRSRKTGGAWTAWEPLHVSHDLTASPEAAVTSAEMWLISAEDVTHDQYQYRLATAIFRVPQLHLTFINSTGGPTTDELLVRQEQWEARHPSPADPSSYPKPGVISRQVWCTDSLCQSGQHSCTQNDPLVYLPVRHLILHHTVSNNSSADWAAVMRAIWNYHAITLCWGDIGYNYLVDMNGNIYEGHRGGDDVVGTHASGANQYSMAVSLLGTFTTATPPVAMQNSVIEIFAWKAAQKGIDVYSSTYHPVLGRGLPNFLGHRDVYGTTACPGDRAHQMLPELRNKVAQRIGFVPPHIYIDEQSSQFTRSGGNWRIGPHQCGFNSHSLFTWSTTDPSQATFWGEWRLNVPTHGSYEVSVYAPYCNTGAGETRSAQYTIYHAGGTSTAVADHEGRLGQWTVLGTYEFAPNSNHRLRLTDLAQDNGRAVWFDAVRVRYLGPQAANHTPADNSWHNSSTLPFGWNILNGGSVTGVRVRVAADAGFNHVLYQVDLPAHTTSHTAALGLGDGRYYWQTILFDGQGQAIYAPTTSFRLDTQPPTSRVDTIAWTADNTGYQLNWSGSDGSGSGVASYKIEYRPLGTADWYTLLDGVSETTTAVVPTDLSIAYEFRSQATDVAGNVEPPHPTADLSTNDAPSALRLLSPLNEVWVNTHAIPLAWEWLANTPSQVRVQVDTTATFEHPLVDVVLPGTTTQYNPLIIPDHALLYWRVVPLSGGGGPAHVGLFRRDATPPSAAVTHVLQTVQGHYVIGWRGADNLSGIAHYTVVYRPAGQAAWTTWQANTTHTSATFVPPVAGQIYEFQARATDVAGNGQPVSPTADMSTTAAILVTPRAYLPLVVR